MTTLLDAGHNPPGYSRETLTGFRDQLARAEGKLSPELEAHLEDLASSLEETPFADEAREALEGLRALGAVPHPTAADATRGRSGVLAGPLGSLRVNGSNGTPPAPILPPRFSFKAEPDEATQTAMRKFIRDVKARHDQRTEEDPIAFSRQHLYVWTMLIGRDAPLLGAEAIVRSGEILFGRFQQLEDDRQWVADQLKAIAAKAKITPTVVRPAAASWWRPVWEMTVSSLASSPFGERTEVRGGAAAEPSPSSPPSPQGGEGAQKVGRLLAAILQQVRKDDSQLADAWLAELAQKNFDLSEAVRKLVAGPQIVILAPSEGLGRESVPDPSSASTGSPPQIDARGGDDLGRILSHSGLRGVNRAIALRYREALQESGDRSSPEGAPSGESGGGETEQGDLTPGHGEPVEPSTRLYLTVLALKTSADALNLEMSVPAPSPSLSPLGAGAIPGHGEPVESIARVFMTHIATLESFLDSLTDAQLDTEGKKRTRILGYAALGCVAKYCGDVARREALLKKARDLVPDPPVSLNMHEWINFYANGRLSGIDRPVLKDWESRISSIGWENALADIWAIIPNDFVPKPDVFEDSASHHDGTNLDFKLNMLYHFARLAHQQGVIGSPQIDIASELRRRAKELLAQIQSAEGRLTGDAEWLVNLQDQRRMAALLRIVGLGRESDEAFAHAESRLSSIADINIRTAAQEYIAQAKVRLDVDVNGLIGASSIRPDQWPAALKEFDDHSFVLGLAKLVLIALRDGFLAQPLANTFLKQVTDLEVWLDGMPDAQLDTDEKKRTKILGYAALGYVARVCGDVLKAEALFKKAQEVTNHFYHPNIIGSAWNELTAQISKYKDGTWKAEFSEREKQFWSDEAHRLGFPDTFINLQSLTMMSPDSWPHHTLADFKIHVFAHLARLAQQQGAFNAGAPASVPAATPPAVPAVARPAHEQAIIEVLVDLGRSTRTVATDVLREDLYRAFAFQLLDDTDNALVILRDVRLVATALGRLDEVERMVQEIINPPRVGQFQQIIFPPHVHAAMGDHNWDEALRLAKEGKNPGKNLFELAQAARAGTSGQKEAMTAVWLHASGSTAPSPLPPPTRGGGITSSSLSLGGRGPGKGSIIPDDLPSMRKPVVQEILVRKILGCAAEVPRESSRGDAHLVMAELGYALKVIGRGGRVDVLKAGEAALEVAGQIADNGTFGKKGRLAAVKAIAERPVTHATIVEINLEYEKLAWRGNWLGALEQIKLAFSDPLALAKAYAKLAQIALTESNLCTPPHDYLRRIADTLTRTVGDPLRDGPERITAAAAGFIFKLIGHDADARDLLARAQTSERSVGEVDPTLFYAWISALSNGQWDPRVARMILPKDLVAQLNSAKAALAQGNWLEALQIIDDPALMSRPFHEQALVLGELTAAYFGKISYVPGLQIPLAHDPVGFRAKVVEQAAQALEIWEKDDPKMTADGDAKIAALLGYVHQTLGDRRKGEAYLSEAKVYVELAVESNKRSSLNGGIQAIREGYWGNVEIIGLLQNPPFEDALRRSDWVRLLELVEAETFNPLVKLRLLAHLLGEAVEKGVLGGLQETGVRSSPEGAPSGESGEPQNRTIAQHLHDWVRVQLNEMRLAGNEETDLVTVQHKIGLALVLRNSGYEEEALQVFQGLQEGIVKLSPFDTTDPKTPERLAVLKAIEDFKKETATIGQFFDWVVRSLAKGFPKSIQKITDLLGEGRVAEAIALIANDPRFKSGDNSRLTQYTAMLHLAKMIAVAGKMGDVIPPSVTPAASGGLGRLPAGSVAGGPISDPAGASSVSPPSASARGGDDKLLGISDPALAARLMALDVSGVDADELKRKLREQVEEYGDQLDWWTPTDSHEAIKVICLAAVAYTAQAIGEGSKAQHLFARAEHWNDKYFPLSAGPLSAFSTPRPDLTPYQDGTWLSKWGSREMAQLEAFLQRKDWSGAVEFVSVVGQKNDIVEAHALADIARLAIAKGIFGTTTAGAGPVATMHPEFVTKFTESMVALHEGVVERLAETSRTTNAKIEEIKEGIGFALALWILKGEAVGKKALSDLKASVQANIPAAHQTSFISIIDNYLNDPEWASAKAWEVFLRRNGDLTDDSETFAEALWDQVIMGHEYNADDLWSYGVAAFTAVKLAEWVVEVQAVAVASSPSPLVRQAHHVRLDPATLAEARRVASRLKRLVEEIEATNRIVPGDRVDDSAYMPVLRKAKELAQMGAWDGAIRIVQKILHGKPKEQLVVFGQLVHFHKDMFGDVMALRQAQGERGEAYHVHGGAPAVQLRPAVLQGMEVPTFDNLPRLRVDAIPADHRRHIPVTPKDLFLFPRYRKILDDIAYLITAPSNFQGYPTRVTFRFFGPAGTGKTTIPMLLAARMNVPLLQLIFSPRTDPSDLEGEWAIEEVNGEKVPVFKPGVAQIAMEHGYFLVMDELDLARFNTQVATNSITDPKEFFYVRREDGHIEKVRVHPRYRCFITENGITEVGRNDHGDDVLRRTTSFRMDPWNEEETTLVLEHVYENYRGRRRWTSQLTELMAMFHCKIEDLTHGIVDRATGETTSELGMVVTPRSILRLAWRLIGMGPVTQESLSRAIRDEYVAPLRDKADRDIVWRRANDIFASFAETMKWKKDVDGELLSSKQIPQPTEESISKQFLKGRPFPKDGRFVWTGQALRLAEKILWEHRLGFDPTLVGAPDQSKTEFPYQMARLLQYEFLLHECHSQTDAEELLGMVTIGPNGDTIFVPGVLTQGVMAPNGAVVLLNEGWAADSARIEKALSPFRDGRRMLIIDNPRAEIPRGDKVLVITSTNDPDDPRTMGRLEQSRASRSRSPITYLAGEFAIQDADDQKIHKTWAAQPVPVGSEWDEEDVIPEGGLSSPPSPSVIPATSGGWERGSRTGRPEQGRGHPNASGGPTPDSRPHDFRGAGMTSGQGPRDPHDSSGTRRSLMPVPGARIGGLPVAIPPKGAPLGPEPRTPRHMMMPGAPQRLSITVAWKEAKERFWKLDVHPGHEEKFGIKSNLVIDLEEGVLMEEGPDGELEPASEEVMAKLIEMREYLQRFVSSIFASMTSKVIPIYFRIWGEHVTDVSPDHKVILLNLLDLLRYSYKGIIGIAAHEEFHALIDGPHPKFDAHEPGRLYANSLGDPRMHANAAMMTAFLSECIEEMLDASGWKEDWSEEEIAKFKNLLPHAQFGFGLIYAWRWKKVMPWIENTAVREALEEALPICRKAWPLQPRSFETVDVDDALADFYAIALEAWPIYERLFPETKREIMKQLEAGKKPEEIMKPSWMPVVIVIRAPKPVSSSSPPRAESGSGEPQSASSEQGEGQPSLPAAQSGSPPQAAAQGGDDKQGQPSLSVIPAPGGEASSSFPPRAESESGDPQSASGEQGQAQPSLEAPGTGSPPQAAAQGGDDKQGEPTQPGMTPIDFSSLPPEVQKAIAEKVFNDYSKALADALEPRDPGQHEARQKAIAQAKANAAAQANAPTAPAPPQVKVVSRMDAERRRRLEAASLAKLQAAIQEDLVRRYLSPQAITAARALPRYLPPDIPDYSDEHFRGGHGRVDVREVIRDRFRNPRTWKVVQRRNQAKEHDAALLLVSDVSYSQVTGGAVESNLSASANLMYMAEHNRVRMDWAEIAFGSKVETLKRFGRPLRESGRRNAHLLKKQGLFQDSTINGSTNIRLALERARDMFKRQRAETRYLVLVTDAQETEMDEDAKSIPALRDELEKMGIKILVIATGDAKAWVPKFFREGQYFFASKNGAEIPKKIVELIENCHKERMTKVEADDTPGTRHQPSRTSPPRKFIRPPGHGQLSISGHPEPVEGRSEVPLVVGALALSVIPTPSEELERGSSHGYGEQRMGQTNTSGGPTLDSRPQDFRGAGMTTAGMTAAGITGRVVAAATNAGLHDVARFLAALPPDKLTAVIRASSSWREVLRRKGFGELEKQMAGSDQKPTALQRLLLVSAALADSENDLATVSSQITGTTGVPVNGASQALPSVIAPAAARPVLQNLLVR